MAGPVLFTACATINPPQPPSLDLPQPPSDLQAVRTGERVTLTWTIPTATTDRQTIRVVGRTLICRSTQSQVTECGTQVGELPPRSTSPDQKTKAAFTDTLPAGIESDTPSAVATYAVKILNREGRSAGFSNPAHAPLVRTLPPPNDFQARVTPQGVALSWAGETAPTSNPAIHYLVRVHRNLLGSERTTVVGEEPLGGENTLIDPNIEWEKTFEYRARTVTVVREANQAEVQVEGNDTPTLKVFADDVFPPAVPAGLQAAASGPGQQLFVDLVWAPNTDLDLAGYNVYRREEGTAPSRLNSELLKAPAYRDSSVVPGKSYIYSVTAVDARGNESPHSEEATETASH